MSCPPPSQTETVADGPSAGGGALGGAALVDLSVLEGHARELGADLVRQIAHRFLSDAPASTQSLNLALADGDGEATRRAAHRLGGGALSVGLTRVAQRTRTLEALLREGGLAASRPLVEELLRDLPEDYAALEAALPRLVD